MRKPAFCICENKDEDQLRSNWAAGQLISAFVFAIRIVKSLYNLNPKFQASSHLVWLYSLVCVGPGRKPRRPVFSQRGSYYKHESISCTCLMRIMPVCASRRNSLLFISSSSLMISTLSFIGIAC